MILYFPKPAIHPERYLPRTDSHTYSKFTYPVVAHAISRHILSLASSLKIVRILELGPASHVEQLIRYHFVQ